MRRLAVLTAFVSLTLLASACGTDSKCANGITCHGGGGQSGSGPAAGSSTIGGSATGGDASGGNASGGSASGGHSSGGSSSNGGASGGHSEGGSATAGKGPIVECPPECFVAITCVKECGGTPVSVGCCPCMAPAFDAKTCK